MTRAGAETTIIVASAVTFASVSADALSRGTAPSTRTVASTFLAFGALGLIALPAPDVGGGLAIAVAGTAFALYGGPLLTRLFPDQPLKINGKPRPTGNKVAAGLNAHGIGVSK